jgi:two-component system chemotaxis response regulator CheB
MRVIVVDDSAFMRRAIKQMLESAGDIEVIGVACNGKEGLAMVQKMRPDVVTLDIEMPEMDGLTALSRIMRDCPTSVLMLSSLTTEGSRAALRALALGAADVLAKDTSQISLSITNIQEDLIARVRALGSRRRVPRPPVASSSAPPTHTEAPTFRPGQFDVICIGSSTGGPPVLEAILTALPESLAIPVVVAQHMPAIFTASLAERLGPMCKLRVLHVTDRMPLERRTIYISPGGKHTHIKKVGLARWELAVNDDPVTAIYRPSVDALLSSAAVAMGARAIGVVLTGMGNDGFEGGKQLHARGGVVLGQNEETCVVYGMPKALTENAIVAASLPPEKIAKSLSTLATGDAVMTKRAG